jgi:hypothetical protein
VDFSVSVKRVGDDLMLERTGNPRPYSLQVAGTSLQVRVTASTERIKLSEINP